MEPGDQILFWVVETDKTYKRGFWGMGRVTERCGPPKVKAKRKEHTFWKDEKARLGADLFTFCDIPLNLPAGLVSDEQLRAAGIDDLEVQVQRQGVSPSWVSKEQLDRITEVLTGMIYEPDDYEATEAAIAAVTGYYERGGWKVADLRAEEAGYDLYCTLDDAGLMVVVRAPVDSDDVVLSECELVAARANPDDWYVAIVKDVFSGPSLEERTAAQVLEEVRPYAHLLKV